MYLFHPSRESAFLIHKELLRRGAASADTVVYRFTFGDMLKSRVPEMTRDVDRRVQEFLSGARGLKHAVIDRRYTGDPLMLPEGVALAKSYVVSIDLVYSAPGDLYQDINRGQKLGLVAGRKISATLDPDHNALLIGQIEKMNVDEIERESEIYARTWSVHKLNCQDLKLGFGSGFELAPGSGSVSGGLTQPEMSSVDGEGRTPPSAAKFAVPLEKLVLVSGASVTSSLDIEIPQFWPSVDYVVKTQRDLCFR